jgi:putative peptidoglycan lipid II flippase
VLHRALPLLAGSAYFKSDVLVDRHLLSMGEAGSLSLFALAQTLWSIVAGVIGQSWGNTAVPALAMAVQQRDGTAFRAILRARLRTIAVLAIAASAAVIVVGPGLLSLITSRALVTTDGIGLWMLLLALVGVPIFGSLGALLSGCWYALGNTRTPSVISAITFTVLIVAKVVVFQKFGVLALCALTTLYYGANATWIGLRLPRATRSLPRQ